MLARSRSDRPASRGKYWYRVRAIDSAGNKYLLDGFRHRMTLSQRWDALKHLHMCERIGRDATLESLAGRLEVTTGRAAQLLTRLAELDLVRSDEAGTHLAVGCQLALDRADDQLLADLVDPGPQPVVGAARPSAARSAVRRVQRPCLSRPARIIASLLSD